MSDYDLCDYLDASTAWARAIEAERVKMIAERAALPVRRLDLEGLIVRLKKAKTADQIIIYLADYIGDATVSRTIRNQLKTVTT